MIASKQRPGSLEMAQRPSLSAPNLRPSSSKSTRGSPNSPDSSDSKASKPFERKSSLKSSTFSATEKRVVRVSERQQQLNQQQEELKKLKDERAQALKELVEAKKMISSQNSAKDDLKLFKNRVEYLELEVVKAKESERKMLESLISQTKQLEQTKISLEEAKLEIRSLKEVAKISESQNLENNGSVDLICVHEDIGVLRNELKLAMAAEEKSKKAMDDLAIALKEVTTEANEVKGKLLVTESELDNVRVDAQQMKNLLKSTEDKYRAALEESERLKLELEEVFVAWNAKEDGFIDCMKVSEEEISKVRLENDKLIDSQRLLREENAKLRDILKQAVNESSVVKETLEIVRSENSQLKDMLSEKENALQKIRQEYESLKVSEAAALGSVNELKSLLAATTTSTVDLTKKNGSLQNGSYQQTRPTSNDNNFNKRIAKFPSDRWKGGGSKIQNGRRHSIGEPGKLKGAAFDPMESPEYERDQMFASISNISDWRVPSSIATDDAGALSVDGFDLLDVTHLDGMEHDGIASTKQKKKKTMFRKFGEMIRRRSFHK